MEKCLRRYHPGSWRKSKAKRKSFRRHRKTRRKSTLPHWWTSVIWKNAELEPQFQKCKGRVVLRGDIVKGDSWAYAVFTEQGSSASQMTAAKVMDVMAPRLWWTSSWCNICQNVQIYGYVFHDNNWPKSWDKIEDCGSSWKKLVRTPTGKTFEGTGSPNIFYWNLDGKKVPNWECLFVHRKQKLFLSVYVDDIKMSGRKQNVTPVRKKLMKNVDLDEQTSFLTTYVWDALNVNARNDIIIEQYEEMFESRVSAGATDYQDERSLTQKLWRRPTTWNDMLKNAWNDIANWRTKRQSNL